MPSLQDWPDPAHDGPRRLHGQADRGGRAPVHGAKRRHRGRQESELIVKDDTSAPDVTKRIAQELVVNDKVNVLAGFGLTPLALATAPIATQSKTPLVVMAAATSSITQASPYIVRTSFTAAAGRGGHGRLGAQERHQEGGDAGVRLRPRHRRREVLQGPLPVQRRQVIETLRVPLRNPDFAPFLQKVRDLKPDAMFVFVPSGAGAAVMKQFAERGMDKAGIKLIGTGDVTDDDILNSMGDVALGVVTAHYSAVAQLAAEQEVRRGLPEGQQRLAPQLHGGGRL
jgi:branched-chain amino acid transport system substrate-binding protein